MKPPKKIQLLMGFILSVGVWIPSSVTAQEIIGFMRCKVMDQGVRSISDGRVKSYSKRWQYYPEVGEQVILTYGITKGERFRFNITFNGNFVFDTLFRDIDAISLETLSDDPQSSLDIFFDIRKASETSYVLTDSESDFNEIFWNSDTIDVDGLGGQLRLQRYYKSDWQGVFIDSVPLLKPVGSRGFTFALLDCRHNADKVDEISRYLSDNAK